MNAKALLAAPILALLLAAPAQGATRSKAERAVEKEMRQQYDIRHSQATCSRLTLQRFRCHWRGYTENDIRDGNVAGWKGTAKVVFYGRNADVTLRVTTYGD
jgi:hypothetical protein